MNDDDLELDLDLGTAADGIPPVADFRVWVAGALTGLRESAEVSIRVVGSDEGRELNHRYRGRDYATNVLSFPAELPAGVDLALIGDLAICAAVVEREAAEQGKVSRAHWAHMTVHGVLHLLDFDHHEDAQAAVMEARERAVLTGLGYPDPYTLEDSTAG